MTAVGTATIPPLVWMGAPCPTCGWRKTTVNGVEMKHTCANVATVKSAHR